MTLNINGRLSFFGAAGTVTGSRFFLELGKTRLLIDCGMFQGAKQNRARNWEPFPVSPKNVDHILLTHAHIDHSGYLPKLCHDGFSGRVHCTRATADLCDILLPDSAHIQEEDARWANKKGHTKHRPALPLYTVDDAKAALKLFDPVHYGESVFLRDDLRVKFKEAGHLLGSSLVDIKMIDGTKSKKFLFSGDLGKPGRPILRDTAQAYNVDYLILESTYGDRLHEPIDVQHELGRIVNESMERGGVLLIPAFSVGRTQTILYTLRELEEAGVIPELPVFVDSPMAIDATATFENHLSHLNLLTRVKSVRGVKVLRPKKLKFCRTRQQSVALNDIDDGAIIISASGMATGGRILHHLARCLPDPAHTVLMVGYQVRGTRGRTILDGHKTVKIHGRQILISAHIEQISGFSGHADYDELSAWLMGFNRPPEMTFLVHGDPEASAALGKTIQERFGWDITIPEFGQNFELT